METDTDTDDERQARTAVSFGARTAVSFGARTAVRGPAGLADPRLAVDLGRVGDRAVAGLARRVVGAP